MKILCKGIFIFIAGVIFLWVTAFVSHASVIKAEKIRNAIIEHLGKLAEDSGIEIETTVSHAVDINLKEVSEPVMDVIVPDGRKLESRVPVRVEFSNGAGEVVKRFQFTAQVKVLETVAVAGSTKTRGEPIGTQDFEMKKIDVSGIEDYFIEPSLLEGTQAKRSIKAGMILTKGNVCPIPVIKRCDRVTIKVRLGSVNAAAEGTARQDGGKGETIKVYNGMMRTTLECVVIDKKTVQTGL